MDSGYRKMKNSLLRRAYDFVLVKEVESCNPSAINALIFSDDGKYLIGGGDDETVRIWNTESFDCEQVVEDKEWGIITALTLAYRVQPLGAQSRNIPLLCVGTSRGTVTLLPFEFSKLLPTKAVTTSPFLFNDAVELQAFDRHSSRLAICSHSGSLKVFGLERMSLTPLWSATFNGCIPGGVFFYGGERENLLTLALNTSELCSRDSKTGSTLWTKNLRGGIGGSALSNDDTTLLVNNLSTGGFDLYHIPDEAPLRSLPILSTRRYTKQCSFLEGSSTLAVCGGDTNAMTVVDLSRNEIIASLQTGKGLEMTQTVAVTPSTAPRTLLAGTSGGSVFVWEKISTTDGSFIQSFTTRKKGSHKNTKSDTNIKLLIVFVLLVTYANWAPPLLMLLNGIMDKCRLIFSMPDASDAAFDYDIVARYSEP